MGGWEVQTHRWQITNSITFFTVQYTTWVSLSPACNRFFAFLPWNRNNRTTISHVHQWRTLPVGSTGNLWEGWEGKRFSCTSTDKYSHRLTTGWESDKISSHGAACFKPDAIHLPREWGKGEERESKIYLKVTRKLCVSCQLFPPNPVQGGGSYIISLRPFGEIQQQFSVKKKMVNCKMSQQTPLKITQVAKIKI